MVVFPYHHPSKIIPYKPQIVSLFYEFRLFSSYCQLSRVLSVHDGFCLLMLKRWCLISLRIWFEDGKLFLGFNIMGGPFQLLLFKLLDLFCKTDMDMIYSEEDFFDFLLLWRNLTNQ